MLPSALTIGYTPPATTVRATVGNSPKTIMRYLIDAAVIHPEEWDNLPRDTRDSFFSQEDRDTLLGQLTEFSLINRYQAGRIKAGSLHDLALGNYRILGNMGSGGSGIVYEAEHILMRRKVAIKVLPLKSDEHPDLITRFLREMRAVARLDHPNIVAAFDAGVVTASRPGDSDLYYFVMEHLTGHDLDRYVRNTPPSIPAACALIYQIASALDEAHHHLLIHRDIKPSNIFVTEDRQAKLLDFGLVRHMLSHDFTSPDVVVGTLEYMAPEQAVDPTRVDIRTDIFGLGATLFYALTGASAFPTKGTLVESVLQRRTQAPLRARSLRPEVPESLENVVQRMMALRPEDRYPTPQAVMHALLPFLENHVRFDSASEINIGEMGRADGTARIENPARVLIVDADPSTRRQFARLLVSVGLDCLEAGDAESALQALRQDPVEAVLLAVSLPGTDGRAFLKALRDNPPCPNLKILMTSCQLSADDMSALLLSGADDCLALPISNVQMVARVRAALKHKEAQDRTDFLSRQLLDVNTELERSLSARTTDLVQARNALVLALARLVEYRSTETIAHLSRIQRFSLTLAQEAIALPAFAGQIDAEFLQNLECCAPLHDIGNVSLPDNILLKAGQLSADEFRTMQTHTTIGADTLQDVAHRFGAGASFLRMAIDIARHHHEHYDGTGYPDGLTGANIPLAARIVTITDAYDALRSRRAQRPALSHQAALRIMLETSNGKFDPQLLGAFQRCAANFERIYRELPDSLMMD
jgi:response regulator RpfG family c-di-GMP phosphodiesterase/tRNA A-37 threonylcarbamoyl transferase component Bud32